MQGAGNAAAGSAGGAGLSTDLTALVVPILEIVWINVVLSGDNALVIALACRGLPPQQRSRGIIAGTTAAIALRVIFTIFFVKMLSLPFVKLIGSLLLLWIAVQLARGTHTEKTVAPSSSFLAAMRAIVVADAVMSLDNVVAIAAAARGSAMLVTFGLVLSAPLIAFGSSLIARLLHRFPWLTWPGAGVLGFIAGELFASEKVISTIAITQNPYFGFICGICGAVLVLVLGPIFRGRKKQDGEKPD